MNITLAIPRLKPGSNSRFSPNGESGVDRITLFPLHIDDLRAHTLWDWTNKLVDSLQERVNEGKDLHQAREMCVFLLNSGLIKILEVSNPEIRAKTEKLQRDVQDRWRRGETEKHETQLTIILHRIDFLAAQVAKLGGAK